VAAKPHLRAERIAVFSFSAVLALTVVAVMGLSRADAAAKQLSCGDTIISDTTLENDLVNCPNNGVIIAADDVTLDLNGHTIDGDGTPDAACDPSTDFCDFGVAFESGDGVTVKNGSIREFEGGLLALDTRDSRLLGLSTARNTFGNIGIAASAHVLVRNCSGNRSTSDEGNGLGIFGSRRIRVVDSSFRNNVHVGIKPVDSTNSVIEENVMVGNGDEGLLMEGGKGFEIRRNRLDANGAGITLGPGTRNVIAHNHVSGGRDGIRIEDGKGNLVADNVVVRAGQAGITLGITAPPSGGKNNLVRDNLVRDSRKDGLVVVSKDHHSLLKRNVAKGSGDDGFDVQSRTTKLTKNRAKRNADLGIAAVRGVIDGGGNRASGNGDQRQCVNVKCR
jgi:parallel beta-helix repeat protein